MVTTPHTGSRRQMTFFSKLTDVVPHIQFACLVAEQKLTASLTHLEDTGTETLYHICFSDGHQGAYKPHRAEQQDNKSKRALDVYERAIVDDLCVISLFIKMKERGITTFRVYGEGGQNFNVWLCAQQGYYHVYYNGKYRFTLRNRNGWQVGTRGEKGLIVNQELASLITKHLDLRFG